MSEIVDNIIGKIKANNFIVRKFKCVKKHLCYFFIQERSMLV